MPTHPPPDLLIAGASTRAAAFSALRAGLQPVCADLFADADLRRHAEVIPLSSYPRGLNALRDVFAGLPWMYAGGLENHPRLVARISEVHPLWGNGPESLSRARHPGFLGSLLRGHGLPALETRRGSDTPPADGNWILKPLHGSGGRGIYRWSTERLGSGNALRPATLREPHVFQEFREGLPISALYLSHTSGTLLVGMARQLVGLEVLHAPSFAWCGSLVPYVVAESQHRLLERIGETVAAGCGLRGLFGCDFILAEQPWLTEVNPRYPASTELHEHFLQIPLLDWHRRACATFETGSHSPPTFQDLREHIHHCRETPHPHTLGKVVYYAPHDLAPIHCQRLIQRSIPFTLPLAADVPDEATGIPCAAPVCTLFATASDMASCLSKLLNRAARFERRHLP